MHPPTLVGIKVDKELLWTVFERLFIDLLTQRDPQEKPFSILPTKRSSVLYGNKFIDLLFYLFRVNRLPLSRLHPPQTHLSDTQPFQEIDLVSQLGKYPPKHSISAVVNRYA